MTLSLDVQAMYRSIHPGLFPAIKANEQVPGDLRARSVQHQMRFLASGLVQSVSLLLTGQVSVRQEFRTVDGVPDTTLHVLSAGGWGSLNIDDTLRFVNVADRPWLAGLLLLTAAHSHNLYPEVRAAWEVLLRVVTDQGSALPLSEARLKDLSPQLKPAMIRLCDALTYTMETLEGGAVCEQDDRVVRGEDVTVQVLSGQSLPQPTMPAPAANPLQSDLRRWLKRGVNVFLTGPTGTFKTTGVNQAALACGANLFSVQGRPGLEDRDFYGGVYPTQDGPQWLAGPVAQAFDSAASGALTVIVFNEVTRFEPLYFNATIGMMDELSGAELAAHGVVFAGEDLSRMGLDRQEDGRFYLLTLPNGTSVACRKELLCFVGTANLGSDYVTTGELDAALLRRYERHVEMEYPDEDMVMPMLILAAGNAELARAGYGLEVFTRSQVVDEAGDTGGVDGEGLLRRPMNFSTTRALLDEARELTLAGVPAAAAFTRAAQSTAVAYCVPRQPNGTLDLAARQRLEDDIHRFAMRLD